MKKLLYVLCLMSGAQAFANGGRPPAEAYTGKTYRLSAHKGEDCPDSFRLGGNGIEDFSVDSWKFPCLAHGNNSSSCAADSDLGGAAVMAYGERRESDVTLVNGRYQQTSDTLVDTLDISSDATALKLIRRDFRTLSKGETSTKLWPVSDTVLPVDECRYSRDD